MDIKYAPAWADVLRRITMAVQTPLHIEGLLPSHQGHLVDGTVTGGAADPFLHMDAVVEVHVIGQIVHASPLDWLIRAETFAHGLEDRGVRPDHGVTIHAGPGGGAAGEVGLFDARVTVATINPVVGHVVFMAERN